MSTKRKIIFYVDIPPPNTGVRVISETIIELLRRNFEVVQVDLSRDKKMKPYGGGGLERGRYALSKATQAVRSIGHLHDQLRSESSEVMYFTASDSVLGHVRDMLAVWRGKEHVSQVVAHVHSGVFTKLFERWSTLLSARLMSSLVDTFVFSSPSLSAEADKYIPESKRVVVPNPPDEEVRCTPEEVRSKLEGRQNRSHLRVLFLSNMISAKGYRDVAEGVRLLNEKHEGRHAEVDFIGGWPSEYARRSFAKKIQKTDLNEVTRLHGRIEDRRRVKRAHLDADVFVLPTFYPTEAQPVSIIEAMNAGTPVISTQHASIPEYVHDDENGYLVEKKSPSQIADRLFRLSHFGNWEEKARAARRTYEERFSPEACREKLMQILRDESNP